MNPVEQAGFSLEEVCAGRAADCSRDDGSCDIETCEQELAAALCEPSYRDDGTQTCVEEHLDDPTQPLHGCDRQLLDCIDNVDRTTADEHQIAAEVNDCYERAIDCRHDESPPTTPKEPTTPQEKTCEQKRRECIALVDGVDAEAQEAGEQACRDMYKCEEQPTEPPTELVCTTLDSDDPLVDVFPGCQALYETCEANESSFGMGENYCEEQHEQCTLDNLPICPDADSACGGFFFSCVHSAGLDENDSLLVEDCQLALHACYFTGQWPGVD